MMRIIRFVLGKILLFLDTVFAPLPTLTRTPEQKTALDAATQSIVLYQLKACPFCIKVRRQLKRLDLTLATKDIGTDEQAHAELMAGGKQDQVPCLRLTNADGTVSWMYESSDINAYLLKQFGSHAL